MPAVKRPAVKGVTPKTPAKTAFKPLEVSRPVVFQLYECKVKLEVAQQLVTQIGIFPGPEEKATSLNQRLKAAAQDLARLQQEYLEEWFRMKGEAKV